MGLPLGLKAGAGDPDDALFSVEETPPLLVPLVPKPANPNPAAGAAAAGAVPALKLSKAGVDNDEVVAGAGVADTPKEKAGAGGGSAAGAAANALKLEGAGVGNAEEDAAAALAEQPKKRTPGFEIAG